LLRKMTGRPLCIFTSADNGLISAAAAARIEQHKRSRQPDATPWASEKDGIITSIYC
jgi:hypothetical protein